MASQFVDEMLVYWDYENVQLRGHHDTFDVLTRLQEELVFQYHDRFRAEVSITSIKAFAPVAYLTVTNRGSQIHHPSPLNAERRHELNAAGVTVMDVTNTKSSPEACDKAIIVEMLFDSLCYPSKPRCVVLMTSDQDFAPVLRRLRMRGYFVVVICRLAPPALQAAAHVVLFFDEIVSLPEPQADAVEQPPPQGAAEAAVMPRSLRFRENDIGPLDTLCDAIRQARSRYNSEWVKPTQLTALLKAKGCKYNARIVANAINAGLLEQKGQDATTELRLLDAEDSGALAATANDELARALLRGAGAAEATPPELGRISAGSDQSLRTDSLQRQANQLSRQLQVLHPDEWVNAAVVGQIAKGMGLKNSKFIRKLATDLGLFETRRLDNVVQVRCTGPGDRSRGRSTSPQGRRSRSSSPGPGRSPAPPLRFISTDLPQPPLEPESQ